MIRGAILAGGLARRMGGRRKGLAIIGGRPILARLEATFQEAFGASPLLVGMAAPLAEFPHLRTVPDLIPRAGVLGGLLTAVRRAPAPVVVAAWDMPFVPAALLAALGETLRESGADVVLPESRGPRGVEPLCAAYGPGTAGPIARALARGDREAIAFHADVVVCRLPLAQVERFGDPDHLFFNVNTPEDLARATEGRQPHT